MTGILATLLGLLGALAWLVVLAASDFNGVALSAGLLAALYVTGESTARKH